jgi:hypothetical protein
MNNPNVLGTGTGTGTGSAAPMSLIAGLLVGVTT